MSTNEVPKPKPFVKKSVQAQVKKPEPKKEEKKPFVRKPHLMQRPFSNEDIVDKLRKSTTSGKEASK